MPAHPSGSAYRQWLPIVSISATVEAMDAPSDSKRVRSLLARVGLAQRAAARGLGISERMMRYYVDGTTPVPQTIMLALESLTAAPEFLARLSARARVESGCACGQFQIVTDRNEDEEGAFRISALHPGHCKACKAGTSVEVASRLLAMSGFALADISAAGLTQERKE